MEYQKFIPEGWEETEDKFNSLDLKSALEKGEVLQGFVESCDDKYNLHVDFGKYKGIIPRNELEEINVDEYGYCSPSICRNKVNQHIQFKIKEIYDDNKIILSRKNVQKDALTWVKNELKPGMVVNGIVKNMRKFGVFVEIGGRSCWIATHRRYFSI